MKMAFHRASRRSPHRVDDFPILLHIRLSARYPPVYRAKRPRVANSGGRAGAATGHSAIGCAPIVCAGWTGASRPELHCVNGCPQRTSQRGGSAVARSLPGEAQSASVARLSRSPADGLLLGRWAAPQTPRPQLT